MNIRCLAHGFALAAALAAGLSAAVAQPSSDGNLLAQARRERELATQKAEGQVRTALTKAKSQPAAEALTALKELQADLEANKNLDESRKTAMTRALSDTIRRTEAVARARGEKLTDPAADAKRAANEARRVELDKQIAERDRVKERVNHINKLLGQRRTEEAEAAARDLAREYPENPAARVMQERASLESRLRGAKDQLARLESSQNAALNDVTKSSTPPKDNLDIDKDITRRNNTSPYRGNGNPLTDKEKSILKAFSKTIRPEWKGVKFDTVMDEFQKMTGAPFAIDRKALEEANIGTDTLVNLSLPREVSTRTALRKVLQDHGLGYVVREEMVYISTLAKTREMMTTRAYYIGDIVTGNIVNSNPGALAQQEDMLVKAIIDSIKKVDPLSWSEEGGKASIYYDPVTKSLIVRQSAEVHLMLRNSMR